jgi:hypothetical protein
MNILFKGDQPPVLRGSVIALVLVLSIFSSAPAHSWPWQSCDSKWEGAWAKCGACTELPARLRPSCAPDDPVLKSYSKGREDPRFKQEMARQAAERKEQKRQEMDLITVRGAAYNEQWAGSLSMSLSLYNRHQSKTLRTVVFHCRVQINNSVELFQGYVYASPSLLPQRDASVNVEFQGKQKIMIDLYAYPHEQQYQRVPSISTKNQTVYSLQYTCNPINAFFL